MALASSFAKSIKECFAVGGGKHSIPIRSSRRHRLELSQLACAHSVVRSATRHGAAHVPIDSHWSAVSP